MTTAISIVSLESHVYSKLFLHAAKHPSRVIFGYLLGICSDGKLIIKDILPVCHSYPSSLVLEICSLVADKICSNSENKLLGIYFANDSVGDTSVPNFINEIATTVQTNSGRCVVLQIYNHLLAEKDKLFVKVEKMSSNGKPFDCEILEKKSLSEINNQLSALLQKELQFEFADFEDHMNDNGVADFTNHSLPLSL